MREELASKGAVSLGRTAGRRWADAETQGTELALGLSKLLPRKRASLGHEADVPWGTWVGPWGQ